MALFAEEGQGSGIASSISLRSIIWQPGSIIAPLIGGLIMDWVGFGYVLWLASDFSVVGLVLMGVSRMYYAEKPGP